MRFIKESDLVILANVPFGKGNLRNLESVLYAAQEGLPVYIFNGTDISLRDYTGGEAAEIFLKIKERGAKEIVTEKELLEEVNNRKDK